MPPLTPLAVAIHLQDDPRACGQACAQMITRFLAGALEQQSAMTSTVASKPLWKTTPDQLADMINQHKLTGDPTYVAHYSSDADTAMNLAAGSIDHQPGDRWPVAALVGGGKHWEVVHGFTVGRTGIIVVHARNPLPDRDSLIPIPPPHTDSDRCAFFNLASGGALEDEAVEWETWKQHYFSKCLFMPKKWKGKFIIVAPQPKLTRVTRTLTPDIPRGGVRIGDRRAASDIALAGLSDSGLLGLSSWNSTLSDLPPSVAYPSLRVEHLHKPGAYYLVSVAKSEESSAVIALDEGTGRLIWARLNPPPGVVKTLFTLVPEGRVVWMPCQESFYSLLIPFVEVIASGKTRYIRLFDRKSFDVLDGDEHYS